jgi:hypothetical protein
LILLGLLTEHWLGLLALALIVGALAVDRRGGGLG